MLENKTLDLLRAPSQQEPLEQIIINHELKTRPSRAPNHKAEAETLVQLASSLLETPTEILNRISQAIILLCEADSAGVSIAETHEGQPIFRWRGIAGQMSHFFNATMPRHFSPCGVVADSCAPQLMKHMIRHYHYVGGLQLPLHEVLLVPFMEKGEVIGTVWAVSHTALKKFDQEDLRLLTSLSHFATIAVQISKQREELTEANIRFENAKGEAERANQFKSDFLANMSHEIRTPLGAMLGFTDLLRDPELSQQERMEFLDIIQRNGENLSVLLNDVLDLSKVEAGHLQIDRRELSPRALIQEVIHLLDVKAKEKGLAIETLIDPLAPATIVADPDRVRQILINVVGNAIKFTSQGRVVISALASPSTQNYCIDVQDTGIGIPAEQRERIFGQFIQAEKTTARKFGGTGLGLSLSRKLAQAMGGDLTVVESTRGQGSTFRLTIAPAVSAH